jgi:MYXO-CTERM domain-containing protein
MVFDSARQRVVLFGGMVPNGGGGNRNGTYYDDTWEWDGTTWTQVASTGPIGRYWHAMAYDSTRQRTVLFGGIGFYQNADGFPFGDTWEWDGSSWTQRAMTRPSARGRHAMAYDSARGVTVLFGGDDNSGTEADTWEWDGTAWNQRTPATHPPARDWHSMAYDAARHATVVFGGSSVSGYVLGDTWEWDGTTWTHRALEGPAPRYADAMAYDSARGGVVLFGGTAVFNNGLSYGYAGDTWEYHTRGGVCTDGTQCDTGNCVDGVCCESASCGTCQACNLADPGICTPVTSGQDPDSCTGQNTCSGGQCVPCAPGQCGPTPDGGTSTGGSGGSSGGSGGNTGGSGGNPGSGGGGGCSCAMGGDNPNAPLLVLVVMLGIRGRRALRRQRPGAAAR